jgi:hypothetical protein
MTQPVRLQLSRRAGFDLQALSRATNGLPVVNVARPGKWGNPYVVGPSLPPAEAVALYRSWLEGAFAAQPSVRDAVAELAGKNLACWCKPGAPCHADVLLEYANRGAAT